MISIHIHGFHAWSLYGSLSPAAVRELFELERSCDPEIPGEEGWHQSGEDLYYAHQIDDKIHISLIQ